MKTDTASRAKVFISHVLFRKKASKVGVGILLLFFVLVIYGTYFSPYSPYQITGLPNSGPSVSHPFGTDFLGHDILAQTSVGADLSISMGIEAAAASVLLGLVVGIFAGYYSRLEPILTGTADIVMVFPALPLMVLMGSLFPPTNSLIVLIMVLVVWPPIARSIRSQVLSIKKMPFVDAAKTSGQTNFQIIKGIILPEVSTIAFAFFVLTVALAIVLVTALQFLGVGNPNVVSWGSMLYYAEQFAFYQGDWWWILAPGVSITLVAMSFALIGFSFEETMNPRLRA